ncbi:MAG TPA: septal ring lytic transglycosylase RlpA family protein [Bryobacteraceae bacterium]|nr:septal ring lytic transglycosylase RlpA family protein [Bryobacteraceae bacterium]
MRRCLVAIIVLAASLLAACGGKKVRAAKPAHIGHSETGVASWYGHPYHGRRAANGEIYDMEQLTAAHRTLPFETWVRVHNLTNDRTVDVRIQDRGPFIDGRIIDLSKRAAEEIDLIRPGIAKVRVTVIRQPDPRLLMARAKRPPIPAPAPTAPPVATPSVPPPAPVTTVPAPLPAPATSEPQPSDSQSLPAQLELFGVQVGAFSDARRAENIRTELEAEYGNARIVPRAGSRVMYRVIVGQVEDLEAANALLGQITAKYPGSFVVRIDPDPLATPPAP